MDPKTLSVEELIADFVARKHASPERQAVSDEIISRIHSRKTTLHGIVLLMEKPLTSPDDSSREHGMLLLSELIDGLHDMEMSQKHVKFYAQFMAERLQDPPCIQPSIAGLRALAVSRRFDDDTAVLCIEALFVFVDIQSQPFHIRHAVFHLISRLVEANRNLDSLRNMRSEFVVGFLAAADSEPDPRNLVLIFPIFELLPSFDGWEQYENELFESIASYFPMLFTPPPDSPASITQAQLLTTLQAAFLSTPQFIPRTVSLMVEKMQPSSSRLSRIQALDTLARIVEKYPGYVAGDVLWRDGLRELVLVEVEDADHSHGHDHSHSHGNDDKDKEGEGENAITDAAIRVIAALLKQPQRRALITVVAQLSRELNQRIKEHDDGTFVQPMRKVIEEGILKSSDNAADLFVRAVITTIVNGYRDSFRIGKKTECLILARIMADYVARRACQVDLDDVQVQLQVQVSDEEGLAAFQVQSGPEEYSQLHGVFMDALNLGESGWALREEALKGIAALAPVMTRMEAMTAGLQLSSLLVAVSNVPSEAVWKAAVNAMEAMQKVHAPAVISAINALFAEIERVRSRARSEKGTVSETETRLVNSIASLGSSDHDAIFTSVIDSLLNAAIHDLVLPLPSPLPSSGTDTGTTVATSEKANSGALESLTAVLRHNTHHTARMMSALHTLCPALILASMSLPDSKMAANRHLIVDALQTVIQACPSSASTNGDGDGNVMKQFLHLVLDLQLALALNVKESKSKIRDKMSSLLQFAENGTSTGNGLVPFPKDLPLPDNDDDDIDVDVPATLTLDSAIINVIVGSAPRELIDDDDDSNGKVKVQGMVMQLAESLLSGSGSGNVDLYECSCVASILNKISDEAAASNLATRLQNVSYEGCLLSCRALGLRNHPDMSKAIDKVLAIVMDAEMNVEKVDKIGLLLFGDLHDLGGVLSTESRAVCSSSYKSDTLEYLLPRIMGDMRDLMNINTNINMAKYTLLFKALSSLLNHVPVSLLLERLDSVFGFMKEALNSDDESVDHLQGVLKPMLAALNGLIEHAPQFFEKEVSTLVDLLLKHAIAPSSSVAVKATTTKPSVQISALNVLATLGSTLAVSRDQRLQVYVSLDAALDDKKKEVRRVARMCRGKWILKE